LVRNNKVFKPLPVAGRGMEVGFLKVCRTHVKLYKPKM
jgi:hypothetical protein